MRGPSDAALFARLAMAVEPRVGEFNMQGLANMAWAFAATGRSDEKLFALLAIVAGWQANL